jgi:hypothetical protein
MVHHLASVFFANRAYKLVLFCCSWDTYKPKRLCDERVCYLEALVTAITHSKYNYMETK